MKYMIVVLTVFLSAYSFTDEDKKSENIVQESVDTEVDTIEMQDIELITEDELEIPEVEKPSALMVKLREWGISLIYKYYDLKDWLLGKINGERKHEDD